MKWLFIFFFCVLPSTNVIADAVMESVTDFKGLQKVVGKLGKDALPKTLIVMDDDDTLTMMPCSEPERPAQCQYIGGPAWYAWQSQLLSEQPKSNFLVADSSQQLLAIAGLLLSVSDMAYTEEDVPKVLHKFSQRGVQLLVLTARGPSNLSATEQQFSNLFLTSKQKTSFLELIASRALNGTRSGVPSFAGPFAPDDCSMQRNTLYQQGVMYVAGQNKGEMLQCFLKYTQSQHIENIVFIDDTLKNVEDVYAAFESSSQYRVKALHLTLLEAHKKRLTDASNHVNPYQLEAYKRWQLLKTVLSSQLLDPAAL